MGCPARHLTAAPLVTVRPNTAQRCHSEPVTDVTGVGIRSPFHANQRPKAATYLCRSAAKARFDNRQPPKGVSKEGGPQPSLFGRFKEGGFSRGKGNRNPFPLEWRSLVTFFRQRKKVTRRRQKEKMSRAGQSPAPTTVYRKPMRHTCGAMWASPPTKTQNVQALSVRADRVVRPYNRLPYPRLVFALSFRASDRRHWRGNPFFLSRQPAALGRHPPLPLRGKGAI